MHEADFYAHKLPLVKDTAPASQPLLFPTPLVMYVFQVLPKMPLGANDFAQMATTLPNSVKEPLK